LIILLKPDFTGYYITMDFTKFVIAYLIFHLIVKNFSLPLSSKNKENVKKQVKASKKITYLVNGREIDVPHWVYYQRLIGLYGRTDIENTKIKAGAKQTTEDLIANYPFLTFDEERDIRAARTYLLDM